MTILINQTPVGFTLTGETSLGDLEAALRAWAEEQDQVVISFLADGRSPTESDPTPLAGVETVEVETADRAEAAPIQAGILADYLELLSRAAASGDAGTLGALREEWPAVARALGDRAPRLEAVAGDPRALAAAAAAEASRLRAAALPAVPVGQAVTAVEQAAAGLPTLATLFHQGRDREALEGLTGFFTALDGLGRAAARTPGWPDWQASLQPFLTEIDGALAAGDLVLTADLLEYEVLPRIGDLRTALGL